MSERLQRVSLAVRTALASALFGLVIVSAGIVVGYWALAQQLEARSVAELGGKRDLVVHVLSELRSVDDVAASRHRFGDLLIGHDDVHLAFVDPRTGLVLSSFSSLAQESVKVLDAAVARPGALSWRARSGAAFIGIRAEAPVADGAPVRYYVSLDRRQDRRLLGGFLQASLFGLPVLLAAVAVGAWLTTRTGLAPLRRFRRQAASIGAQSLGQRLSDTDLPSELSALAHELNGMLQRIDFGYRRLQEFSVDLAHELRTPIATLLGRSQVALSQQRSPQELREVLEGNIEELERLARLIADMLFIAQTDHEPVMLQEEAVGLHHEAHRVAEYLSLVAEEKSVTVSVRGDANVRAGRLLVQRAITNLLSNAIRHASRESQVTITIGTNSDGHATVAVSNVGDPIPPEVLGRIFDRFYRADASRARLSGGAGLGLAIVRSIMDAHNGDVLASSDRATNLTTFTLVFPREQTVRMKPEATDRSLLKEAAKSPSGV